METFLHLAREASSSDDDSTIVNGFENRNSGRITPEFKEDCELLTAGSEDFERSIVLHVRVEDRESSSRKLLLIERR